MTLHALFALALAFCFVCNSNVMGANILCITPITSTSHYNVIKPIHQELAKRGHNITIISAMKDERLAPNVRHIQVDTIRVDELFGGDKRSDFLETVNGGSVFITMVVVWSVMLRMTELTLESKPVQEFIKNDNSQFDVILCEEFNLSPYYMLAHKYKAPLVTFMAFSGAHYVNNYMANPMDIQHVPYEFSEVEDNLWGRIKSVVFTFSFQLLRTYYFMPKYNQLAQKNFGHLPQPLPNLMEIEKNISLVFINTHFSIDYVRSWLPNMIEFGGIHLKEPQPLSEDLRLIMDNSKNGVVYFSMGSNVLSKDIKKEKVDMILQVFSSLKQTVLWKWDNDSVENVPPNVVMRKWFSQTDVLAHPNVRVFISHGGLLSTIETLYRGVPIVGMPILGDQHTNVAKAVKMGCAVRVDYYSLSVGALQTAVEKVLNDPSYSNRVKYLSKLVKDRPLSPMDNTIYWIEYVIRHKGANHMKSPSSWMPWYQYYLLDVIAVLTAFAILSFLLIFFLLKTILKRVISSWKTLRNKTPPSSKKQKQN